MWKYEKSICKTVIIHYRRACLISFTKLSSHYWRWMRLLDYWNAFSMCFLLVISDWISTITHILLEGENMVFKILIRAVILCKNRIFELETVKVLSNTLRIISNTIAAFSSNNRKYMILSRAKCSEWFTQDIRRDYMFSFLTQKARAFDFKTKKAYALLDLLLSL